MKPLLSIALALLLTSAPLVSSASKECVTADVSGPASVVKCNNDGSTVYHCGIDPNSGGRPVGCVSYQSCNTDPDYPVQCKPGGRFCCCKPDPSKGLHCNDIRNLYDDKVWRQACTLEKLKHTKACQNAWTPPPPSPTRVTADTMAKHCLDFCIEKVLPGGAGPYYHFCGPPELTKQARSCPKPCPSGCDAYCVDGSRMYCPKLPIPTTPTSSDTTDDESKEKTGLSVEAKVAMGFGVLLVIALAVAFAIWYKKSKVAPRRPYAAAAQGPQAYAQQPQQLAPGHENQPQQQYSQEEAYMPAMAPGYS